MAPNYRQSNRGGTIGVSPLFHFRGEASASEGHHLVVDGISLGVEVFVVLTIKTLDVARLGVVGAGQELILELQYVGEYLSDLCIIGTLDGSQDQTLGEQFADDEVNRFFQIFSACHIRRCLKFVREGKQKPAIFQSISKKLRYFLSISAKMRKFAPEMRILSSTT